MEIKRRVYSDAETGALSALALAHIGDALYEMFARTRVISGGKATARGIHNASVALVSAPAQADVFERIKSHLTNEERAVYTRGRNANMRNIPKNATVAEYHTATGLEALFGYLYLTGNTDRAAELFELGTEGK